MKFEDYLKENSELLQEATFEHHKRYPGDLQVAHHYDFQGKKVGKTPNGHHIYAGHTNKVNQKGTTLAIHVVHKDSGKIVASHSPHASQVNNETVHKAAIAHAKSTDHFWSDRENHKSFVNHGSDEQYLKKAKK